MENKNTITIDTLNSPQTPIKLPSNTPDMTNFGGITSGVYDTLTNEYNLANKNLETLQNTQNTGGSDIVKIIEEMAGKTADTAIANKEAGVETARTNVEKYAQTVADLQSQASVLNREAQAIPIQVQEQFKGTGATDIGVAPIQTAKLRENALKALSIAQQQDIASAALTGSQIRLQAAKDKAQQIIDLKYKPLEDKLAIKKQQYELNKDVLESYDKKRTEALNAKLKEEERILAEEKQTKKDIQNLTLEVAQIDPSLVSSVSSAKTIEEAISLASPALSMKNREIVKIGDSTKLIDKLTGKVIKDYGIGKSTTTNNFAISKNTLDTIKGGDIVSTIADVINTSGAKQSQSTNDAINVISGLQQFANDNPDAVFVGTAPIRFFPGLTRGKEARAERLKNKAALEAINLKVQQWASGAALTKEQTKQVERLTPQKNDTDFQIKNKVNQLANYMIGQVSGQLAGQGIGFSMDSIDLFNKLPLDQDPLKVTGGSTSGKDSLGLGI